MMWWFAWALAQSPADIAEQVPAAEETLVRCAELGCDRDEASRAAALLAVHRYVEEGVADGVLAATVEALDAARFEALPDVVKEAAGEPLPWARRVGGAEAPDVAPALAEALPVVLPTGLAARLLAEHPVPDVSASAEPRLVTGAALARDGKLKSALRAYRELAEDDGAESDPRALALLRSAYVYLDVGRPEVATAFLAAAAHEDGRFASQSELAYGVMLVHVLSSGVDVPGGRKDARRLLRGRSEGIAVDALDVLQEL